MQRATSRSVQYAGIIALIFVANLPLLVVTPVRAKADPMTDKVTATYRVRPIDGQPTTDTTPAQLRDVLQRRLSAYGIDAPDIQTPDADTAIIAIPPRADAARILRDIGQFGLCEFVASDTRPLEGSFIVTTLGGPESVGWPPDVAAFALQGVYETIIQSPDIRDASMYRTFNGTAAIQFTLHDASVQGFDAYTDAHIGRLLSIVVDKRVFVSSVINSRIGATGVIEGLPATDIPLFVALFRSGPLPVSLEVVAVSAP